MASTIEVPDFVLRQETVTVSTNAYSNVLVDSSHTGRIILSISDGSHIFTPFLYADRWYAKVTTDSGTTLASGTQITCTYYYI